jgi:uncharacterized protein (DUF1800 family)
MNRLKFITAAISLVLTVSACGGGSSPDLQTPDTMDKSEAFRFLNQTTFGATEAEAQRLIDIGTEAWIDDQMLQPASLQLPHLRSLPRPPELTELQPDRVDIWFRNVLSGDDQLRQRVAFALSEIMVVSQLSDLGNLTYALADYYDLLARNAFANYRDLIQEVTLHPAMGIYLSMLGNEKPDDALNIRPDENYARELMQLFSIGLVKLNLDGSTVTDDDGLPVPTYDQSIIEGFAHVYTGWHFAGAASFKQAFPNDNNQTVPMQLYPEFHDTGEKLVLNGETIPAGQTGEEDLADALDNIFNHSNVGPFIAIRLIHRLVTSNPSPAYVERVVTVFNDNGSGVRGDLAAVVKAILLDDEARPAISVETDGKVKEPLLRLTQVWRAYDATSASGRYPFVSVSSVLGQGPLQSPSVFNFFSPFYAPPGEIRDAGLAAPELGIATEYQNTLVTNYLFYQSFALTSESGSLQPDHVYINIDEEIAVAADADALVDLVAEKLVAGDISPTLRDEMVAMVNRFPESEEAIRVGEVIYLISTSPEFAIQG